eukprot:5814850-Lingulodinium_polyedra.AAC.1
MIEVLDENLRGARSNRSPRPPISADPPMRIGPNLSSVVWARLSNAWARARVAPRRALFHPAESIAPGGPD